MRIIKATLEHLDLLTPLFVKYREFYGQLPCGQLAQVPRKAPHAQ